MSFLIPEAVAAEGAEAAAGGSFEPFIMLAIFAAVFYFLIWRPQSKRNKEHKNLIENLGKGDEVCTSGGVVGKIVKVDEGFVGIEVADNVELTVQKQAIVSVLPKGTLKSI
ncbi:MAG: preprotein translocase subunit YajC [Pseudomonadales bacterium]|jgi:preprotein translocase subunit YajC